ncbi:MAG TPA: thiolase family protein [Acidimicrobiales bacterium]|nr:thiolase family protein [Acidimicrobiales bacterium]
MTTRGEWGHAVPLADVSGRASIVGVGEAGYSRASGRTAVEIALDAAERAIDDAGLRPSDIDGLTWSEYAPALTPDVFRDHFGVDGIRFTSDQCGGMTGAGMAPYVAADAIAHGRARYVLNTYAVAWATERERMVGGPGESYLGFPDKRNLEVPYGFFPQPVYFAAIARRHMLEFGTTEEQFGSIATTFRQHANRTPSAVMHDRPMTLDDYLASPMIADPLRLFDCCLISDGGAAFVTTSSDRAADHPHRPVTVAGVGLGLSHAGLHWSQQDPMTATPQVFAAPGAFRMAGIGPADVDVLALYDPFTIVALMQVEDMGFCAKGDGGPFVADGGLSYRGGRLPVNTHGGLLSHAYVLGIAHVVEIVRQLRGSAAAQVGDCRVGVYGGFTGADASTLVLVA